MDNSLDVDADVTDPGSGYRIETRSPSAYKDGPTDGIVYHPPESRTSRISCACDLTGNPIGSDLNDQQGLQKRADEVKRNIEYGLEFLFQKLKELNDENRMLRDKNETLERKLIKTTTENHHLKREADRLRAGGGSTPDCERNGNRLLSMDGMAHGPTQTVSTGNKERNVDPVDIMRKQEGLDHASIASEVSTPHDLEVDFYEEQVPRQERRQEKEPSPQQCAYSLAEKIPHGDVFNNVLRNMNVSQVDIQDIAARNPNDPKEQRVEGITMAVSRSRDRIPSLLRALVKAGLRYQAEQFCEEFGIDQRRLPDPVPEVKQKEAPAPDAPPPPEPQTKLEEALRPFLKDRRNLPRLTEEVKKEGSRLTEVQAQQFKAAFHSWKPQQKAMFDQVCVSRSLLGVMNAWASVELSAYSEQDAIPAYSLECLVRSCRAIARVEVLKRLKKYLHTGVVGPSEKRDTYLRSISHTLKLSLIQELNVRREGVKDWRTLAEDAGYNDKIALWSGDQSPAERLWEVWTVSKNPTVGDLYDWALKKERFDIAAVMEDEP